MGVMYVRSKIRGAFLACTMVASAAGHPIVAAFERFHVKGDRVDASLEGGMLLLNELNCVACHAAPDGWRERLRGRGRIRLNGVGARVSVPMLEKFVAQPAAVKPGSTMPALLSADDAEARALAEYVASLPAALPVREYPPGDAARGRRIFGQVGCAACHEPPRAETTYASVPIALAGHAERGALAAFLQNPLHSRPGGRMPATELSDGEAADLAAYLSPGTSGLGIRSGEGAIASGRKAFAARNCASCHETGDGIAPRWAQPLQSLRAGEGCLSESPVTDLPWFHLSNEQRSALGHALQTIGATTRPQPLTAEQKVATAFEQLNCYACHEWRGRGGAEPARAALFSASDAAAESLGEIGHLPPKLDQSGRKLTAEWLRKLLLDSGGGVRPYMTARMPRFGESASELISLLEAACRPDRPHEIDVSGAKGHHRFATGRTLLGTGPGGLGCVACHGVKDREPAGVRAINLTHTAQRLRPEYFKALLLDPQGLQPGTIMPPLLTGRPNAGNEIESMWTYFKELDQSNVLPEGLAVPGSFELKPADEGRPIVFRTFLENAGTQAIAVGYPEGLHAAFDAFEVRWAVVWRGRFLDAQSNWEERPMKPVRALGEEKRVLPARLPLARLGSASEQWPESFGTYAGYQFRGYRLDAAGVPTFRYDINGLEVEDTLRPGHGGKSLQRTLRVRGEPGVGGAWYFRGLRADDEPRPVQWENGHAVIEETLWP